jgi:hypothetical protein
VLSFDDIAESVKRSASGLKVVRAGISPSLRLYRHSGGRGPSWRTAGAYLSIADENRLVLEALYLQQIDTCVVRVYQESPLKVLYARKFGVSAPSCAQIMDSAFAVFAQHLPSRLPMQPDAHESLGPKVERALLPIPPPVNVADVPG